MLSVADVLGAEVGPEEIRNAALTPVSEIATRFGVMLAACARGNLEAIARVLAGLGDDEAISLIMTEIDSIKVTPARRPRSTAVERDQAAAAWFAGPAWALRPEPEPSPYGEP